MRNESTVKWGSAGLLACAVIASLLLVTVTVADDSEAVGSTIFDNWSEYEVTAPGEVSLTKISGTLTTMKIPETISDGTNDYTVTAIASEAGLKNALIQTVTVPSTVKSIGDRAFMNCNRLFTVELSDGLQSIGAQAFYGCKYLSDLNLQDATALTSIGNEAFYDCRSIKTLTLPSSLTSLGTNVFDGCKKLTDIHSESSAFINLTVDEKNVGLMSSGSTVLYAVWSRGPKEITIPATVTTYRCSMSGVNFEKVTMTGNGSPVSVGLSNSLVTPSSALSLELSGSQFTLYLKRLTSDIPGAIKNTAGAYDVYQFIPTLPEGKSGEYQIWLLSNNKYYTPYEISESGEKTQLEYSYEDGYYKFTVGGAAYLSLMSENKSLIPNAQEIGIALIIVGTVIAVLMALVNHRRYGA